VALGIIPWFCQFILSCSPSGWDNMKKISILYENMQSMKPDDYYRDVIVQPAIRKVSQLHRGKYNFEKLTFWFLNCTDTYS
jgi:hypothetical protein